MNSSLLLWHSHNTALHTLFSFLQHHYAPLTKVIYKFDHYLEMMLLKHLHRPADKISTAAKETGESLLHCAHLSIVDFIGLSEVTQSSSICIHTVNSADAHTAPMCCYFQDHCAGRIIDYFEYISSLPVIYTEPPSIICFPLKPKPHQLLDVDFIRQHWLGEKEIISSPDTVD